MYKHCIFCTHDLRQNELIESLPVGRRLAFDPSKGRLWVICSSCRRWNLVPILQRWEAVEQCESVYHQTRTRYSTENIGYASIGRGVGLIRIGTPRRAEFAAWRYGTQLGRRRYGAAVKIGIGAAAVGGAVALGLGTAIAPLLVAGVTSVKMYPLAVHLGHSIWGRKLITRFQVRGDSVQIRRGDLHTIRLARSSWRKDSPVGPAPRISFDADYDWQLQGRDSDGEWAIGGAQALGVAYRILPMFNWTGAGTRQIRSAVETLDDAGGPDQVFSWVARHSRSIRYSPAYVRLALEMASQEEVERYALEAELLELHTAWQEAEELAAIADGLLMPAWVERRLEALRAKDRGPAGAHDG